MKRKFTYFALIFAIAAATCFGFNGVESVRAEEDVIYSFEDGYEDAVEVEHNVFKVIRDRNEVSVNPWVPDLVIKGIVGELATKDAFFGGMWILEADSTFKIYQDSIEIKQAYDFLESAVDYTDDMKVGDTVYIFRYGTPPTDESRIDITADGYEIVYNIDIERSGGDNFTDQVTLIVEFAKDGLIKDSDGVWKYFKSGKVVSGFTGFKKDSSGIWRYLIKGVEAINFVGVAKNPDNGGWFYVKNGKVDWNYTGLAKNPNNGQWFYVTKGQIKWGVKGLVKHNGQWFYVSNSTLSWGKMGVAKSLSSGTNQLFFYRNSVLDWSYSGYWIDSNAKIVYTIKKGVVVRSWSFR